MRQLMQMNITWLKIPTGGRQTSWLFTTVTEELNQGLPRNNSSLVVRASLRISSPNHSAMLPPFVKYVNYNNIYSVGAFSVPFSILSRKDMAKDVLLSNWFFLGVKQTSTHTHLGFFFQNLRRVPLSFLFGSPFIICSS